MNNLDTANVHLLLVEDNERYLKRAIRRLKEFGYEHIDTALDEDEAREKLAHKHFDVIISDMRLGSHKDGGFTIVDEVKQRQITSIIIILTANDTMLDCRRALKGYNACWDYISKSQQQGSDKSPLEELDESIQEALAYLNDWGNSKDEKWIADNADYLQEHYINQHVAVINNIVLASADSEAALKQKLEERKLPFFLPVIQKIEMEVPLSIAELIQKGESTTLEFKRTFQYDGSGKRNEDLRLATFKTLVAFLNSKGGTLLIGVEDEGDIYGLENDFSLLGKKRTAVDLFEQELTNLICDRIGKAFAQHIAICFEEIEGKQVCGIIVKKAKQKAFYKRNNKRTFFCRVNCTTREIQDLEEMCDYLEEEK